MRSAIQVFYSRVYSSGSTRNNMSCREAEGVWNVALRMEKSTRRSSKSAVCATIDHPHCVVLRGRLGLVCLARRQLGRPEVAFTEWDLTADVSQGAIRQRDAAVFREGQCWIAGASSTPGGGRILSVAVCRGALLDITFVEEV